jgi:acyl-CoA thioesterase
MRITNRFPAGVSNNRLHFSNNDDAVQGSRARVAAESQHEHTHQYCERLLGYLLVWGFLACALRWHALHLRDCPALGVRLC